MYTTPQSCTPHLNKGNGRQTGNALLHLHGPEQVNYFNPHNTIVTPLSRLLYLST